MINKRYFVVFFEGFDGDGMNDPENFDKGRLLISTKGKYPSERSLQMAIKEKTGVNDPFITNIIEMTEEDFFQFSKDTLLNDQDNNDNDTDFL